MGKVAVPTLTRFLLSLTRLCRGHKRYQWSVSPQAGLPGMREADPRKHEKRDQQVVNVLPLGFQPHVP